MTTKQAPATKTTISNWRDRVMLTVHLLELSGPVPCRGGSGTGVSPVRPGPRPVPLGYGIPRSLFLVPCSPLLVPRSLFLVPYSPFLVPPCEVTRNATARVRG